MKTDIFLDFYEDLQVSPNADQETIERVYRLLAKRYHPDNRLTGDLEKFDIITKSYKVLSDPEKRAAYDAGYDENKNQIWRSFVEKRASNEHTEDKHIRISILSILYVERRRNISSPGVGLWQLEKILGWPEKILEFHIWYLKEKSWIERTDTGGFAITAVGADEIEGTDLILRNNRLLTQSIKTSNKTAEPILIEKSA